MAATALKQARMEFKTTEETKGLISLAAKLTGVDVTAFVLGFAAEKAREVVSNYSMIQLSLDGQRKFAELLKNPPAPTQAMKELGELPDFDVRQ